MLNTSDGSSTFTRRAFKRSYSPDHLSFDVRKSKITKIHFQQDKNVGNKENHIKRFQSEMVLTKHSSSTYFNKENLLDISPWYQFHSLWSNMMTKTLDKTYKCRFNFLDSHPSITNKMRSVLFDWLIEVCEVYHLHRETYHLSIVYIDQYLCNTTDIAKNKLQLLGITALFVASKIEEIYPPRLADFAYVTDSTYCEEDILDMELDLMNTLNWYINPVTSISWLLIYLQVESEMKNNRPIKKRRLSLSNSSKEYNSSSNSEILKSSILTNVHRSIDFLEIFSLAVRLLDLCSLDIEYNQYSKHILAASAILSYRPNWPIQQITALTNDDLSICREWMKPFVDVLSVSTSNSSTRLPPPVPMDEVYSIQIHNISIDFLENVYKKRPKFVPSMMNNRPFRDLVNHLSWLPRLLEKEKYEEQQEINEIVVIV